MQKSRIVDPAFLRRFCEDSIFYTPGRIGAQPCPLAAVKGRDPLDQPNGADGDQILLIRCEGIIFFHNMGHQPEIALDEDIPGFQIPLGCQFQIVLLLLGSKGFGEAACLQLQRIQQAAEYQPNAAKHGFHLHGDTIFTPARPVSPESRIPERRKKGLPQQSFSSVISQFLPPLHKSCRIPAADANRTGKPPRCGGSPRCRCGSAAPAAAAALPFLFPRPARRCIHPAAG